MCFVGHIVLLLSYKQRYGIHLQEVTWQWRREADLVGVLRPLKVLTGPDYRALFTDNSNKNS